MRTTSYHPQTDGLTERFNHTLRQMLRKFVGGSGTDWNQWLPYLLFAYKEMPQSSAGFSSVSQRSPSITLTIWEGNPRTGESKNVVSYVVQMREKLAPQIAPGERGDESDAGDYRAI